MARGDSEGGPRRRPSAGAGPRTPARKLEPARPHSRAEPPPPLARFAPERLAGFLELALQPAEMLRLCRKVGANSPGYRLEKLSPPDLAALLAKEYADEPRSQPLVEDAVAQALKSPALRTMWLTPAAARELAQLVSGDPVSAAARLAWRYIGDGDPAVRAAAERAIDAGAALLEQVDDDVQRPGKQGTSESTADEETERRVARAEREKEAARALLQQARGEVAERDRRLNELKGELAELRLEHARQGAELSRLHASRSTDERKGAHELRRLAAERTHLDARVHDLEERLAQERHRADHLAQQLAHERERAPILQQHPPGEEPVAEAGDFAVPHFTSEFYESLLRWDRRIVKTAFEKALLLARDRRHPSLRALPLEGIENYFRIRVATDVRLIYRRGTEGRIEILSLIDREDLERYVKQAKTRRES